MLKIFRKIRQELIAKGEISRYVLYAIGEILLVMIGILFALQINNWNEQRKENLRTAEYLIRLEENIEEDKKLLKLNIEFYEQVFSYGSTALAYASGQQLDGVNNWQVLVSFFHASQIGTFYSQNATYEELKSSGEISLIPSSNLRNDLSFYYGPGINRYDETIGVNPLYRKMVRGIIPAPIQNYFWENCHRNGVDFQVLMDCPPAISEQAAKQILNQLSTNQELIGELRFYMSSIKVGLTLTKQQEDLCDKLLAEINTIISKS